jgi:hypothetical protein
METAGFSATLIPSYQSAWNHIKEDSNRPTCTRSGAFMVEE